MKYDVLLRPSVWVKIEGVEAESPLAAVKRAEELVDLDVELGADRASSKWPKRYEASPVHPVVVYREWDAGNTELASVTFPDLAGWVDFHWDAEVGDWVQEVG